MSTHPRWPRAWGRKCSSKAEAARRGRGETGWQPVVLRSDLSRTKYGAAPCPMRVRSCGRASREKSPRRPPDEIRPPQLRTPQLRTPQYATSIGHLNRVPRRGRRGKRPLRGLQRHHPGEAGCCVCCCVCCCLCCCLCCCACVSGTECAVGSLSSACRALFRHSLRHTAAAQLAAHSC